MEVARTWRAWRVAAWRSNHNHGRPRQQCCVAGLFCVNRSRGAAPITSWLTAGVRRSCSLRHHAITFRVVLHLQYCTGSHMSGRSTIPSATALHAVVPCLPIIPSSLLPCPAPSSVPRSPIAFCADGLRCLGFGQSAVVCLRVFCPRRHELRQDTCRVNTSPTTATKKQSKRPWWEHYNTARSPIRNADPYPVLDRGTSPAQRSATDT